MTEVNKTLYIPLYGKAKVSKQGIILHDPMAEQIWQAEGFPIKGKSKSKWLSYNMAMRARVFDDWTRATLREHADATVLHISCGLDSRCRRVDAPERNWVDCDFPEVIAARRTYYEQSEHYAMKCLDAADKDDLLSLPDAPCAIVVLEGIRMYLPNGQRKDMLRTLREQYPEIHILMDVYTQFAAKASRYKNPVHDVGVTCLYGVDDIRGLLDGTGLHLIGEHSFTPDALVAQLKGFEKRFFKLMFTGKLYGKLCRLFELWSE